MNATAPLLPTVPIEITDTLIARFWAKVEKADGDACWLWTSKIHKRTGYGRMYVGGGRAHKKERFAHRVAWTIEHGPIDDGISVLHKCDNPPCVRASHLFTGTQTDNIADAKAKGRMVDPSSGVENRAKKSCVNGHPFDAENTGYVKRGVGRERDRYCRACRRAVSRRHSREQQASNPEGVRARKRKWRALNRHKVAESNRRSYQKRLTNENRNLESQAR